MLSLSVGLNVASMCSAFHILLEALLCEGKPRHLHDDRSREGGLGNEHRLLLLLDHAPYGHALEVFLGQEKITSRRAV